MKMILLAATHKRKVSRRLLTNKNTQNAFCIFDNKYFYTT